MEKTYLLKLGEMTLRKQNYGHYLKILRQNIKRQLKGSEAVVEARQKRMYIHAAEEHAGLVTSVLDRTFGLAGYAEVIGCERTPEAVDRAAVETARAAVKSLRSQARRGITRGGITRGGDARGAGRTDSADGEGAADRTADGGGAASVRDEGAPVRFKVEARRADKGFPLTSYEIARRTGSAILDNVPGLKVSLDYPDFVVNIEIREKGYVYGHVRPGLRGLPVGSSGKGLLLLSGGIDSPVAGYLMARRGMRLSAVHFHAYPFTSVAAQQKAEVMARIVAKWSGRMRLYNVPMAEIQKHIQANAKKPEYTLLFRAAMMKIASDLVDESGSIGLITGESLGQVASQTPESMRFTESYSKLPVFRPLISYDKEEIIDVARRIGTFRTSIMPFADCCVLISPEHPLIHPTFERMTESFRRLEMEALLEDAKSRTERRVIEPLFASARSPARARDRGALGVKKEESRA